MPNRSSWHTPARRPASPWIVLAALVVVAGATFALGAVITDRLTRPLRTVAAGVDPGAFGGVFETVTLRSADDRADLDAWLLPVPGFDAGVVLVHGKDGSKSNTSGDGRYAFGFMERFDVIAGVQQLV